MNVNSNLSAVSKKINEIIGEINKAVIGKSDIIVKVLMTIISNGHILIEDMPGVGKTTMALAFSKALSLEYKRMQFTPDVLPTDIVFLFIIRKIKNLNIKREQPYVIYFWLMKLTERQAKHNPLYSKSWKNAESQLKETALNSLNRIL